MTPPVGSPVRRATSADRAFLAMDRGPVPEQFGIVLVLEPPGDGTGAPDLQRVQELVSSRLAAAPRLRQRLVGTPLGAGGPVWVDDPGFDVVEHVHTVSCPAPGDEQALLDCALSVALAPLGRDAPLWCAVEVTGLVGGRWALVMVLHHVLTDGLGGLTVLGALVDGAGEQSPVHDGPLRHPPPSRRDLYADASRRRLRSMREVPRAWRQLRAAMSAAGGLVPAQVAVTTLLQPTGPARAARVVHTDLEALREAVHPWAASANDAVLVAVGAALGRVQAARGEVIDEVLVTVPVSGRPAEGVEALGNMVSPMLVPVPTRGAPGDRITTVAERVRARRTRASGPPPIALLGGAFRSMARLGAFRWYMNHQHRTHTLVSHVRGPRERLGFAGCPIVGALPVSVGESGNMTVQVVVMSYAGQLALTVIADPEHFHELDRLAGLLEEELDRLVALPRPESGTQSSH